ncbi:MAG: tyrosine-protein phosphatase [Phycisphaerae bacterium]|nr:tyrosine-protein phosphatase [Phycisphaerae bacterium]
MAEPPGKLSIRRIAALGVAVCLGVLAWRYGVRDQLIPRNFGVVEAGQLYRAGRLSPSATEKVVRENGIRTIVDLGAYEPGSPEERVAAATARALGVERHVFRLVGDGTGNPNAYVAALRVMGDASRQPVLVHCATGAQRTSGAVCLFRVAVQKKNLDEVFPESFRYRHDPRDNPRLRTYLDMWSERIVRAYGGAGAAGEAGLVPGFEAARDEAGASPEH